MGYIYIPPHIGLTVATPFEWGKLTLEALCLSQVIWVTEIAAVQWSAVLHSRSVVYCFGRCMSLKIKMLMFHYGGWTKQSSYPCGVVQLFCCVVMQLTRLFCMIGTEEALPSVWNYRPNPLAEILFWPAGCVGACRVSVAWQPMGLLYPLHALLNRNILSHNSRLRGSCCARCKRPLKV